MELFQNIFLQAIINGDIQMKFQDMEQTVSEIIEGTCYQTLKKIKAIIADDSLNDKECFMKIEEIVSAFEEIGDNCSGRHDFG
ncbi:MAG: hypothetical protein IKK11_01280 [Oscillospiraceae bacterium]|nr:hypothetical protein [Oscillospiraceae bacterium]